MARVVAAIVEIEPAGAKLIVAELIAVPLIVRARAADAGVGCIFGRAEAKQSVRLIAGAEAETGVLAVATHELRVREMEQTRARVDTNPARRAAAQIAPND